MKPKFVLSCFVFLFFCESIIISIFLSHSLFTLCFYEVLLPTLLPFLHGIVAGKRFRYIGKGQIQSTKSST